jgi:hypothetical protein
MLSRFATIIGVMLADSVTPAVTLVPIWT